MTHPIEFLVPDALWGLLAAFPLVFFLRRWWKIRSSRAVAVGSTPVRFRGSFVIVVGALLLMTLSAARPYVGYEESIIPASGEDVMVIFDVSKSMLAADMLPSRFEDAKRKLLDLISLLERRGSGDRIGIVLFAGESYLFCPLTADYSALRVFANAIAENLISQGGSAINTALTTSIESFKNSEARDPRALLLSDGEDNALELERAVDSLKTSHLRLDALGFGTPEGAPIEVGGGRFLQDGSGQIVVTRLNETSLERLAQSTGGLYRRARLTDDDLAEMFPRVEPKSLASAVMSGELNPREGRRIRTYNEIGPFLIWAALLLIFLAVLFSRRGVIFIASVGALVMVSDSGARAENESPIPAATSPPVTSPGTIHEAYEAYGGGDFERAAKGFEHFHAQEPDDWKIAEALASSNYKLGRFAQAEALFKELVGRSRTGRERYRAHYNLGNAQLMGGKLEDAIHSYEEALLVKPNDTPATHNLEVARKLLEEKKKKEDQKKDEKKNDDEKKDEEKKKDQQKDKDQNKKDKEQKDKDQKDKDQKDKEQKNQDQKDQDKKDQQKENQDKKDEEKKKQEGKDNQDDQKKSDEQKNEEKEKEKEKEKNGATPTPESGKEKKDQNTDQNKDQKDSSKPKDDTQAGATTPTPSPEGTPAHPEPSPGAGSTPTPGSDEKDQGEKETESPGATPAPTPSGDESEHGESNSGASKDNPRTARAAPTYDPHALKQREADAWLESLPDAPVILRKKYSRSRNPGGQTW